MLFDLIQNNYKNTVFKINNKEYEIIDILIKIKSIKINEFIENDNNYGNYIFIIIKHLYSNNKLINFPDNISNINITNSILKQEIYSNKSNLYKSTNNLYSYINTENYICLHEKTVIDNLTKDFNLIFKLTDNQNIEINCLECIDFQYIVLMLLINGVVFELSNNMIIINSELKKYVEKKSLLITSYVDYKQMLKYDNVLYFNKKLLRLQFINYEIDLLEKLAFHDLGKALVQNQLYYFEKNDENIFGVNILFNGIKEYFGFDKIIYYKSLDGMNNIVIFIYDIEVNIDLYKKNIELLEILDRIFESNYKLKIYNYLPCNKNNKTEYLLTKGFYELLEHEKHKSSLLYLKKIKFLAYKIKNNNKEDWYANSRRAS